MPAHDDGVVISIRNIPIEESLLPVLLFTSKTGNIWFICPIVCLSIPLFVQTPVSLSLRGFFVWLQLYHVKCTSISLCKGCKTLFLYYPDYNFFSDVFTTKQYASIEMKGATYFCVI